MSTIPSLFQQTNPYEPFVMQLVELESQQLYRLEARRDDHDEQKKALGDVSSSISEFISKIDELSDPNNKPFEALKTESSDDSIVRVNSASGIDRASAYNIDIERIASRDTQLSQITTGSNTDLAAFGNGTVDITIGDQTETITIEVQKDDGTGTMVDKTNEEILNSYADAINEAFEDVGQATVFKTSDDEFQLSIGSLNTGSANKVEMSGATGIAAEINNGLSRLVPETELDAKFTIDGVTFERSDNNVDDAIEGLDFTLLKGGNSEAEMLVDKDIETSKGNIDDFIEKFNEMNRMIRSRTFIDGDTGSKGPLQDMRSIRNLSNNLRLTGLTSLPGTAEGEIARLEDIGIVFENNGNMKLDDADKLKEALNERPDEIISLFSSEDSPIADMKAQAESYTKSGGLISSLESGVEQKIDRLDRRIASEQRYLEDYEERQRSEFNELQLIISRGQEQYNQVANFQNTLGF